MTLPLLAESFNFGDGAGIAVLGFVLVIAVLAVLAFFVKGLSKSFSSKKGKKTEEQAVEPIVTETVEATATAPAEEVQDKPKAIQLPYTPGYVTLDGVNEQDAAVIMAITADKLGVSLDNLIFNSIKLVEE